MWHVWGEEKWMQEFLRKPEEESSLEALCGRRISKFIWKEVGEGVDGIYVAQGKAEWRAAVNTVMNLRVPQNAGNFFW
jgi:hypothetical protein